MPDIIKCPNCGELSQVVGEKCEACDNPVIIKELATVIEMSLPLVNKYVSSYRDQIAVKPNDKLLNESIAFCYLRLKLYDKALSCFENAMEENFDNSTPFFYAGVCMLKGQKAFVLMRPEIDKIEGYINAALMIETKGIYRYFLAYIKYDYYGRKHFNTSPTWQEALQQAKNEGLSDVDIAKFYQIIGIERPNCM